MILVEGTDQQLWDDWIINSHALPEISTQSSFLHSWEWGRMQESYGYTVHRAQLQENNEIHGAVLFIVVPLPMGKARLFTPRGPLFSSVLIQNYASGEALFEHIVQSDFVQGITRQSNSIFWRFEPAATVVLPQRAVKVKDVQPSMTRILDLSSEEALSEEDLLSAMKQKTRYNIRLAEKKGVSIEFVTKDTHPNWKRLAAQFTKLVQETSHRHGIRSHPASYYMTLIESLGATGMCELVIARHEGDVLAMNLMIRYGSTMTYLHGGATHHKKNLMAPYLLQWAAIKRAKKEGYTWYDFYGIGPEGDDSHPFAGVTRFKSGFGGRVVQYPGTFEFPFSPVWYKIYRTIQAIR